MLIKSFFSSDGYKRLATILLFAWFVFGGVSYVLSLGSHLSGPEYSEKIPAIVNVWESFCGQLGLPVFNIEILPDQDMVNDFVFEQTFSPLGFMLYMIIPGALLVLSVFAIRWINAGFRTDSKD